MNFSHLIEYNGPMPEGANRDQLCAHGVESYQLYYTISDDGRLFREEDDSSLVDINYTGPLYVFNNGKVFQSYIFNFNELGRLENVNILYNAPAQ